MPYLKPRGVASPLSRCTAQTLIDAPLGTRSPTAKYAPIESPRPIDKMAVLDLILQRQAITRVVRDARRAVVDKNKRMHTKMAGSHEQVQ